MPWACWSTTLPARMPGLLRQLHASPFSTCFAQHKATSSPRASKSSPSKTIPLAVHILRRLRQHGCSALHGVPGDFTLPFLSYLRGTGMHWVGSCNELNAAYAADGYARVAGLGSVCTTFGVGELSAINGIAGSYAERVPVVHIVGTPRTELRRVWKEEGQRGFRGLVHHALGRERRLGVYRGMAESVVAEVVDFDGMEEAAMVGKVDDAIRKCLVERRPIYIDLPSDLAALEVVDRTEQKLKLDRPSQHAEGVRPLRDVFKLLDQAQRPLLMVDGLAARFGWTEVLNEFVEHTGIPTMVTTHGLGIIDSRHHNYYGVYSGSLGSPELKRYVDSSDFVMLFGELFSDTATGGWDAVPSSNATVNFSCNHVKYNYHNDRGELLAKDYNGDVALLLKKMLDSMQNSMSTVSDIGYRRKLENPIHGKPCHKLLSPNRDLRIAQPKRPESTSEIYQDYIWPRLSSFFRPHDTILLANGTPLIGGAMFDLPSPVRVIASGLWFSIGQMLPAAQGVAMALSQSELPAERRGRTILLEGDGSFQTTAQELSTVIRNKLDMTILLVNNRGYAYERLILGPNADYNAIADWDYTLAPKMMGKAAEDYPIFSTRVRTVGELEATLDSPEMKEPRGLKFIEVMMGEKDVPGYFRKLLSSSGEKLGGNADDAVLQKLSGGAQNTPRTAE